MEYDPLAQYRKKPIVPKGGNLPPAGTDEYMAFGTKDKVRRLRIRSLAALVNSPGYNILLNVVYDGPKFTHFILVYSVLIVKVQGRNLQKLIYAIENEMADYIQVFDPDKWQTPTDTNTPYIESIELMIVENGKPVGDEIPGDES